MDHSTEQQKELSPITESYSSDLCNCALSGVETKFSAVDTASAKTESLRPRLAGISLQAAKSRMALNLISNVSVISFSMAMSLVLAPYLIRRLGVASYGMVGLANSFPAYLLLATQSLSNSLFRHISVEIHNGRVDAANVYFNTAFKTILVISALLSIPVVLVSLLSSRLFNVPAAVQTQTSWLILLVLVGSLVGAVAAPFGTIFPLTHRFLLQNVLKMVSMLFGLAVLVGCFWLLPPSMVYVGLYQLVSVTTTALLLFCFQSRFQRSIVLQRGRFSWQALREMYRMAGFILVDDLATLMVISANVLIVNKTLGAIACGHFAPIVLIWSAFMTLGSAVNNVIMPVMYHFVGRGDAGELRKRTLQAMRLVGGILGVPVIVVCGLARPILNTWLGDDFVFLWPLVWAVVLSIHFARVVFQPFAHVYRGMDCVRFPAYINLGFGLANLVLVYVLLSRTDLGLWGLGLAFALTFGLRGLLVNSLYCDHLLGLSRGHCLKHLLPSFVVTVGVSVFLHHLVSPVQSVVQLIALFVLALFTTSIISAFLLLTPADRDFLHRLIQKSFCL